MAVKMETLALSADKWLLTNVPKIAIYYISKLNRKTYGKTMKLSNSVQNFIFLIS